MALDVSKSRSSMGSAHPLDEVNIAAKFEENP